MVLKDDCTIVGAECGSPAGKGPAASCKHSRFVLLTGQILQVTTNSIVLKPYQPTTSLESAKGKEAETRPSPEPSLWKVKVRKEA